MQQVSMNLGEDFEISDDIFIMKNCIIDRGSKYTIVIKKILSKNEIKPFLSELKKDKYYRKATHNTYAYRLKGENEIIQEGKNDDGETGAGMCILREMKRKNIVNGLVIVTRYFGGVYLQADRFKNVINSCKLGFEELKK